MIQYVPDESRKWAQPEWGVPGEYPRDGAVSVFMDRYLHAERAQTRQASNRLSTLTMSSKRGQDSIFDGTKQGAIDELSPHRRSVDFASDNDGRIV